jgi:hypothetical protein
VAIECPDRVVVGEPLTFRSTVTGGTPGVRQIYNWHVSAGTIIDGQGTDTIHVDTTGLAGQSLTATLSMGGYELDCTATCTVQFPVPVECRKFDEFPAIALQRRKGPARQLHHSNSRTIRPRPRMSSSIRDNEDGPGEVQRHTNRIVDYLVNSRGVNAQRIVTLVGPPARRSAD